ncbi:MAG: copper resistance protein NlpE [Muribaculaceae bacterium]|nr:copper resistance protein NlpE [Muribaculaceae bacterium]
MKKIFYFAALGLSMVAMAACSGNKCSKDGGCVERPDEVYSGLLPAADCEGIRYTLKVDYEDDKNNMAGDYDLTEIYIMADSTSATGVKDGPSYKSEGDFTVVEKDGKKYLKLVKDAKDSNPGAASDLNFLVSSDSTLTMVNADLEEPATPLLYTLKIVK